MLGWSWGWFGVLSGVAFLNIMEPNEQEYDADGDRILDRQQLSVLQQEEREQARIQQRQNAIRQQRGFKGERAFIAKPAEIAFRDFVVGKPHYLVITLTNVSNAFNSFNVMPLPEKIRNYFQVEYTPKGKISPGITCDIRFKFLPQLNEDIFSEFTIQAETGSISYPIVCTSRKTIVRCPLPVVDFGRIIYGESKKARLAIRNEGSLPSHFCFLNPNGTEIGQGNTPQEMKVLDSLTFERRGEIGGNAQKVIVFEYRPSDIGSFEGGLQLSVKNVLHSPPIAVRVIGECVEVPVRVEHETYDLQICLLGHIYRERLRFYNQSEGPMSFKMSQPPQTKKYFEFNPVVGYIQKQASLDVWVKFTADKDILIYLARFLQDNKNSYRIPFQMTVKEQLLPVDFALLFRLTSDKLTIRPSELNFGRIFEGLSSRIEVQLENQSELPQEVLLGLKKSITIENDQPLLKLLPLQTLKTHLTFNSSRLSDGKNYRQEDRISCRVITGQIATSQLELHYACEVTRPDLTLTHNKIDLPALQVGEQVQASTTLRNNSAKDLIFEIFLPDFLACGLKLTPVVRHLPARQEVQVNIEYHSFFKTLSPALMRSIADKNRPKPPPQLPKDEPIAAEKPKKEAKKEAKLTKQQQEALEAEQRRVEEQERARREREEAERAEQELNFDAEGELAKMGGKLFTFGDTQHYQWLLPIYFKQKDYSDVSAEVNFLQVTTTSISEVLAIDSREVDFGQIAVGSRAVREVNISNRGETAQLRRRNMPIFSSFNVLNSLKEVPTGGSFKAVLEFQPIEEQRFSQRLEFYTDKYSVSCQLKGKGVRPEVAIEPESGLLALGGVLVDQYVERTIKIKNVCNFEIHFSLVKVATGVNNTNSSSAFTYVPSTGPIPAHGATEVKVRFRPDRISEKYFQKVRVHVEEQKEVKHFYLTASSYPRQAYLTTYRPIAMPDDSQLRRKPEYAFDSLRVKDEAQILGPTNKTIVLEYLRSEEKTSQKKLVFGSCKLLDNKMEKPTNFQIILPVLYGSTQKDDRFQCDMPKGVAAAGNETTVTFTYKQDDADPLLTSIPALAGMGQWRELKGEIKLSGGFVKPGTPDAISLDLILRFYVSQL